MLVSLVIHNSFVSDIFMDDIAYMSCQHCDLHLEFFFNMIKISNIYVKSTVCSILDIQHLIYTSV